MEILSVLIFLLSLFNLGCVISLTDHVKRIRQSSQESIPKIEEDPYKKRILRDQIGFRMYRGTDEKIGKHTNR